MERLQVSRSILQRVVSGSLWSFAANVAAQMSTFISGIIAARVLGQEQFGAYLIILNTFQTIATVVQLSAGYTANKYIAEYRNSDPQKAGRIASLCAMITTSMGVLASIAIVLFGSNLFSEIELPQLPLRNVVWLGAGYVLFSAWNGFQIGVLAGLERFSFLTRAGLFGGIFTIVSMLALCTSWGLQGALIALFVAAGFRFAIHALYLRVSMLEAGLFFTGRAALREIGLVWQFSAPASLSGLAVLPVTWLVNIMITGLEHGYQLLAIYGAAENLRILVLFIPNTLNRVSLSVLNNMRGNRSLQEFKSVAFFNFLGMTGLTALGAILVFTAHDLFLGLYGPSFAKEGRDILAILLISTVFESAYLALYQELQSENKLWGPFFLTTLPWRAVFLLGSFAYINSSGLLAVSWSYTFGAITGLAGILLLLYLSRRGKAHVEQKHRIFKDVASNT
jgi:O-antigen/teichoic acid export membrane protein